MCNRRKMWQMLPRCTPTTHHVMAVFAKRPLACAMVIFVGIATACRQNLPTQSLPIATTSVDLQQVDVNDSRLPVLADQDIAIFTAKNESTSFAICLGKLPQAPAHWKLRVNFAPSLPADISAYQALPMPVDTNRAGYVRQTGLSANEKKLPRALLPIPCANGSVDLSTLRDPNYPFDPKSRLAADSQPIVWIDLHIPQTAAAGDYAVRCEVVADGMAAPAAVVQGTVHVYDFAIPD